jgi:hypothetical protein
MTDAGSQAYAERYFREAATLRLCQEYNEQDYNFAREGGRIVYLFDANVVRFFIDPEREADHVVAFHSRGRDDLDYQGQDDYAPATALITAEFLFSRALSGQRGSPPFIAAAHGEEINDFLNAMMNEAPVSTIVGAEPMAEEKVARLNDLIENVTAHRVTRDEAVEQLRELVPEAARLLIGSQWSWSKQLLRLYDEDRIRPLALDPRATLDILTPDPARCTDWSRRLLRARRGAKHPLRARRDAEVLVQTMLLDEEAAKDTDGQNIRYVMVTADNELFDTYARWFWDQPRAPNERFVLRLPLQFAPILNALEMPNGLATDALTAAAREALDSLFANLKSFDFGYAAKLPYYRDLAAAGGESLDLMRRLYGENPLAFSDDLVARFRDIRRLWHECFKTGVVLNTNLLERRQQEFQFLADCLRENLDLRTAVVDDHRRNLQRIQDAHAYFNIQLQIATLQDETFHDGDGPDVPAMFADARLTALLGPDSLQTTIAKLGARAPLLLERIEQSPPAFDLMLLAAALAHRCERWEVAALFGRRALELAAPEDPMDEAALVLASATRLEILESRGGLLKLDRLILAVSHAERAESRFVTRGDAFGAARAAFELNALFLTWLAWRAVHGDTTPPTSPEAVTRACLDALDLLSTLREPDPTDALTPLHGHLRTCLHANIVRAAAIDLLEHRSRALHRDAFDDAALDRALAEVTGPISGVVSAAEILAARSRLGQFSAEQLHTALDDGLDASTDPEAAHIVDGLVRALRQHAADAAAPHRFAVA